jgi:hypothetical protein
MNFEKPPLIERFLPAHRGSPLVDILYPGDSDESLIVYLCGDKIFRR